MNRTSILDELGQLDTMNTRSTNGFQTWNLDIDIAADAILAGEAEGVYDVVSTDGRWWVLAAAAPEAK